MLSSVSVTQSALPLFVLRAAGQHGRARGGRSASRSTREGKQWIMAERGAVGGEGRRQAESAHSARQRTWRTVG